MKLSLVPKTFRGQMLLLMFSTLVLLQLVSVSIYLKDRDAALGEVSIFSQFKRISSVVSLLEQANPSDYPMIEKAVSGSDMYFSVSAKPEVTKVNSKRSRIKRLTWHLAQKLKIPTQWIRVELYRAYGGDIKKLSGFRSAPNHRLPHRHKAKHEKAKEYLKVSIYLDENNWLNAASLNEDQIPSFAWRSAQYLLLIGGLVLLMLVILVRTATRPLERLAQAASRFGRNLQAEPIAVAGPTEFRQTISAFNEMQGRLKRFISDRTLMLAAISHDLRTPLTSLRLRAEFIEDPELKNKILQTLQQMEQMLRSTLDFAKEDAKQETPRKLDFSSLVQSLCDDMADVGQPVSVKVPKRVIVECKPIAIKRALTNLIVNGIKYGEKVKVKMHANKDSIKIIIDDQGPGIAEDLIEKVFTPFFRLDSARNSDSSVGLGLSVARTLIHAQGGQIELTNLPEKGLRATLILPR